MSGPPALRLVDVGLLRHGRWILQDVSWEVRSGSRWLVLGANGSGKTSLIRLAALYEHPTTGTVEVLGERLGAADVRQLRRRVGLVSAALAQALRPGLVSSDVVVTAHHAALEPWWHHYDDELQERALDCLERMGVRHLAGRTFGSLSSGEQQRVLLARALMNDPGVLLLDEPSARLDLAGREHLVAALTELIEDPSAPPLVLVTHHVDEVPPGMTDVLLLREGRVLAAGALDRVLTAEGLTECFGLPLDLQRRPDGRLSAFRRRGGH